MITPRHHRAASPYATGIRTHSLCRQFTLDGLAGAPIADILFAWDEHHGSWLANGPIIVRLETCDLAVAQMHCDRPSLLVGSIDTETPLDSRWVHQAAHAPKDSPILWKSYRPLSQVIGKHVDLVSVSANDQERKLSIRFSLEDGDALEIANLNGRVIAETAERPHAA